MYPKPEGWNGGPDGRIVRQGSGSRLSVAPGTAEGECAAREDRRIELEFDDADFGGYEAGQPDHPMDPPENYEDCYGDA